LKQKFSEMNTGGVGTSTKIGNTVIYDPNEPLFTFNQGFETLDEIDGKFLQDYLHLCEKVDFTPQDERKFRILYKNFRKNKINKNEPKSLNKYGNFDLTNELKARKKKEWWAKLKYRLLKLINTKHSLISIKRKPLPQEMLKDKYFDSIFNPPKVRTSQKSVCTDPDVLSLLEQFKQYYDKEKKEKKSKNNHTTNETTPPNMMENLITEGNFNFYSI